MPVINNSSYRCPKLFKNRHIHTIYAHLFRKVKIRYERERIETGDGDFLDIDWAGKKSKNLLVITHGMESSAEHASVKGMAKKFSEMGFTVAAWNLRGCSGEMNKAVYFYHAGCTKDLDRVIRHTLDKIKPDNLYLAGFSLGGNITLKYLGDGKFTLPSELMKAAVISVPVDLEGCGYKLGEKSNRVYLIKFMRSFYQKMKVKAVLYPEKITVKHFFRENKTIRDFDDHFTAPQIGYQDAMDYWKHENALQFLKNISIPVLMINALDDPFLTEKSYPYDIAGENPCFYLETPEHGGHVGFITFAKDGYYWHEKRTAEFFRHQ